MCVSSQATTHLHRIHVQSHHTIDSLLETSQMRCYNNNNNNNNNNNDDNKNNNKTKQNTHQKNISNKTKNIKKTHLMSFYLFI